MRIVSAVGGRLRIELEHNESLSIVREDGRALYASGGTRSISATLFVVEAGPF